MILKIEFKVYQRKNKDLVVINKRIYVYLLQDVICDMEKDYFLQNYIVLELIIIVYKIKLFNEYISFIIILEDKVYVVIND